MSWWKNAKPGDKVVCIETWEHYLGGSITKGTVYSVRDIKITPWNKQYLCGIRLQEIKLNFASKPKDPSDPEGLFPAIYFKPLKNQELPLSLRRFLTEPLTPVLEDH